MSDSFTAQAVRDAGAAARAAEVTVREVSGLAELAAVGDLFTTIWGKPSVSTELLRAFSKTQSYVGGAFRDGALVGACVAFHAAPRQRSLHSHIAGVTPGTGGRGVGFALKVHQRAWALALGVDEIAWTYDPLVARNAHFNINKLAARPAEYLTNFYGPMSDAINGVEDTDRVLVRWDLRAPAVVAACRSGRRGAADGAAADAGVAGLDVAGLDVAGLDVAGLDVAGLDVAGFDVADDDVARAAPDAVVPVPLDIERLRVADPAAAHEWRLRVRESLRPYLAAGSAVGYDRERGYLIRTQPRTQPRTQTEGEHP